MGLVSTLFEILQRPTLWDVLIELMIFIAPLWIAVFIGVLVGWAWKPKWANLSNSLISKDSSVLVSTPFCSIPSLNLLKLPLPNCVSRIADELFEKGISPVPSVSNSEGSSSSLLEGQKSGLVTENDLENLFDLVEEKDRGPAWIKMMDRSTPTMNYQAWRRDPESGPPQYRTRTIYEDTTPEMVRDFFWDDEFRPKWDDMLIQAEILEECTKTGTMVVQWTRKFPFFCSDREYIIGRRIWKSGGTYYCVTKGVPYSVPRRNKPKRVDLYYSSWCIRAVESSKGDGQLTVCEVLLFHHEDMGIPWEIAKLGIRQGMWGAVKKINPGLRVYQKQRASGAPLSRYTLMAQINTKVSADYTKTLEHTRNGNLEVDVSESSSEKQLGRNIPRFLVVGGAVALACTLDRGLLTKAVIFGVARRFAKIGKRL